MSTKNKRLLLIEPPFYRLFNDRFSLDRYPLSLGYLAGAVQQHTTWEVRALNADFTSDSEALSMKHIDRMFTVYTKNLTSPSGPIWQSLRKRIAAWNPAVVGITSKSQNYRSAQLVAEIVKACDPDTLVVVGGPHPSMTGPEVLGVPHFDVAVRGEGEQTLVELLSAVEQGAPLDGIEGIVFRRNGEVVETPARTFVEDLDTLPHPHRSAAEALIDREQFPPEAFSFIFATRGCPNNCFYCGSRCIWSRRVRYRSAGNVTSEIRSLQAMGLKHVHFDDDFFGVNKRYIAELCEALVRDCPGMCWSCEIHPRLVSEETIAHMKQAGCDSIMVGIESGNNDMLKKIRKNITIEDAVAACETIKKHRIVLQAFFMVGFPEETEETMRDTFAAMKRIAPAILAYSIFTPYPGTEAFEFCKEKGLIGPDYDPSLFNHQSPANFFCLNMDRERFRALAAEIQKFVVRNNAMFVLRNKSFSYLIEKVRKHGVRGSVRKAFARVLRMVHP